MGTTSRAALGNTNRRRPDHDKAVIELARQLWDDDGLSASKVAKRVGLSRNAICSIAHRNCFDPRPSPIRRST